MNWIITREITVCAMCLLLAGCGTETAGPQIGADVTEVRVTHILGGQMTDWTVQSEAVDTLRDWAAGLEAEPQTFPEGQTPGDNDGGEGYTFAWTEAAPSEFSYVINGEKERYLLADGTWYAVKNPSDPPVEEPE